MRMRQEDLDADYDRVIKRSDMVNGCRLPIKTRMSSRDGVVDKLGHLLKHKEPKKQGYDVTMRSQDGRTVRFHQIVYMKTHSNGEYGEIPVFHDVIRTCNTKGCLYGPHLKIQSRSEREELKKQARAEAKRQNEEIYKEQRKHVRDNGLSEESVRAIYDTYDTLSTTDAARLYGCSYMTAYRIRKGMCYTEWTGHIELDKEPISQRTKLTAEQVLEIRGDDRSTRQIAEDYNVSHVTIARIKNMTSRIRVGYSDEDRYNGR